MQVFGVKSLHSTYLQGVTYEKIAALQKIEEKVLDFKASEDV